MPESEQSEIVSKACRDIERRIGQAIMAERQTRMTNSMVLLDNWNFTYAAIADAILIVFGETITSAAVKMRVRAWKKCKAEGCDE